MCNDPTINMRMHVTCTEETHFAFEARRDVFQLIVGRGGQGDGSDGSSVHLHLFDPQIVLPRLAEVVRIGQEAMDGIAVHGRADQVVRAAAAQAASALPRPTHVRAAAPARGRPGMDGSPTGSGTAAPARLAETRQTRGEPTSAGGPPAP